MAASTTLLAESRTGRRGGMLPWALLVVGSIASLAANVTVADPDLIGCIIAAWPSFALTASYELLTRQVRCGAADMGIRDRRERKSQYQRPASAGCAAIAISLGRLSVAWVDWSLDIVRRATLDSLEPTPWREAFAVVK